MKSEFKIYKDRGIFADAMLDKYVKQQNIKKVSDIGASFGFMQEKIESLNAEWQPFDYVKKHEKTIIWDLNNPCPADTKADAVIFLEVLEHLANPLLGLQNIANHINKGGILILTTPNPASSKNTLHLLLKGKLYAFQEKHLAEHHVFTPWEHIVRYFLETAGFEVLEYAVVDTSYMNGQKYTFKDKTKRLLERIIEKRRPKAQGMSYGMVARRK